MCRSTDNHRYNYFEREGLKLKAFYVRLLVLKACKPSPDSLTLVYLPRISGSILEINGNKVRPDLPAFVVLHRVVAAGANTGEAVFGSRERVRAGEGVRFEIHLNEDKMLKGIFRKDKDEEWNMECKSALENELVSVKVSHSEVYVAVEGHATMSERVEMVVKRKKKGRGFEELEEIPEESELEGGCSCSCSRGEEVIESDVGDCTEEGDESNKEVEMEGVRWAVDVGIWVMCLGVGYLVTKASSKRLSRRRLLL